MDRPGGRLGNETEETRTVHKVALDAEFVVVGQGRNPQVDLVLTRESDGSYARATSARLQLVRADGKLVQDTAMRWQDWRYRAQARGTGTVTLQAVIEVDGHTVLVEGPEVRLP